MENKYSSITLQNLNSFCRFCLLELKNSRSGRDTKFHQFQEHAEIMKFVSLGPSEQKDKYPNCICQKCFDNLQILQDFCTTALHSMQVLEQIISNSSKPNKDWLHFDEGQKILTYNQQKGQIQNDSSCSPIIIKESLEKIDNFFIDTGDYKDTKAMDVNIETEMKFQDEELFPNDSIKVEPMDVNPNQSDNELQATEQTDILSVDCAYVDDSSSDVPIAKMKTKLKPSYTKSSIQSNSEKPTTKYKSCKKPNTKKYEIKFHCELCPRRFISKENLDAHSRIHKGLKPFQCKECDCSYVKATRLREHIQAKHSDAPLEKQEIACTYEECDKIFRHNSSLKMHYNVKHVKITPVLKTYICENCGRTCKNLALLRRHLFTHGPVEDYPYQCQHCGKRYISQCTYKEHLLRHAGIKNFECHFCGMKKTTRKELLTHINFHTKERQWSCPICPSVFNTAANLRRHDRVVHKGIRSFSCRYCSESFGKPDTLKHHEMRHTGEKPHVCSVCSKRFIQSIALKTHMKTHLKNMEKAESSTQNIQTQANDTSNSVY